MTERYRPGGAEKAAEPELQAADGLALGSAHIRAALAERLGMRAEVMLGRTDWREALAAAVPFQRVAAQALGNALEAAVRLRGLIAGMCLAIANSRDWGEEELIEAVARHGYGDGGAVSRLDLLPFSGSEAVPLLLTPTVGSVESEGVSLLARVVQARQSGLLVFDNFDTAHPLVQQHLLDGARRGRVFDYRGRDLHVRSFVAVFLLKSIRRTRPLGFRPQSRTLQDGRDFALSGVDAAVALAPPDEHGAADTVLPQTIERFKDETGVDVNLSAGAQEFLRQLPANEGLSTYRERVSRLLAEAAAEALAQDSPGGGRVEIELRGERLKARCIASGGATK